MYLLPKWVLTGTRPAAYDSESATCIEMTAKLYGAMQNLIEEYNSFADSVNETITANEMEAVEKREEFTNHINKIMHDFIHSMEEKFDLLRVDLAADLAEQNNETVERVETLEGHITQFVYDPETETLHLRNGVDEL